jgi:putative ABC transport system permease protein
MDWLRNDLRYSLRTLRQSHLFTIVALLTLALGIGANTAIFTVVKSVLLEPLPYPEPERLVVALESNIEAGYPEFTVSPPNFRDFHDQNRTFEALAAMSSTSLALTGGDRPERLRARQVTGELFQVYGTEALRGRTIEPDDDRPDAPRVAVLGHGCWQRLFAGDPGAVGRTLHLDGNPTTVIGVMPSYFSPGFDVFVPLAFDYEQTRRGSHWLIMLGRLAPEATIEQAREDLKAIAAGLEQAYPESNTGWSVVVDPMHDRVIENIEPALLILTMAVGLVLLIACANVANLMLSRLALRERDIAVRLALGAGRWQLTRQMLVESTLLALAGGLLGFVLAIRGTTALVALSADELPRYESITVDAGVLGFTIALSLVTGIVFGLMPALRASRPDLQQVLRDGGRGQTGIRGRLRSILVLVEVALALVLLIGAGLLVRSFSALLAVDPGFEPEGVLTVQLELPESKYPDDQTRSVFYEQLFDRLDTIAGVESAGGIMPMPLTRSGYMLQFFIEGQPRPPLNQEPVSNIRDTATGYFETVGVPLLRGRIFTATETSDAEPVAVVNQSAAEHFWPDQEAVDQRITFGNPFDADQEEVIWWRVVGVVGDVHHESLAAETEPEIYLPLLQRPDEEITLVLRTAGEPTSLVSPVRSEIAALDPDLPLFNIRTLQQIVDESVSQPRFNSILLALFAGLALLLAAIGVYGLISYSVTQRLREIGVRLALGAGRGSILRLVLGQGMLPVAIGSVSGIGIALVATRLLSSMVFAVSPTDPVTFASVTLLLLAIAVFASLAPAWRATRVDPMVVLRDE